mgnify:CR=1 FL=1
MAKYQEGDIVHVEGFNKPMLINDVFYDYESKNTYYFINDDTNKIRDFVTIDKILYKI